MICENRKYSEVKKQLLPREEFHPFPAYGDSAWSLVPERTKKVFTDQTAEILNYEIPLLTATNFMGWYRSGTDRAYGKFANQRREMLANALTAECFLHDGRLLDKITDIVWAICEETSWIAPGHNNHMHNYMLSGVLQNALPDIKDKNFIDLHIGGTAGILAWTYYFLRDALDEISPLICERIEIEIMRQVIEPFMSHDDLTWFGFYGHKINNWNPFIINNILAADLICVKDPDLRAKCFYRCLDKMDIYLNALPSDGGCDEGPAYWDMAGGAVYDCFTTISYATNGKIDLFRHPFTKKIAEYIAKAHLCGNHFANFADNAPETFPNYSMLYRYGRNTDSDFLRRFAMEHVYPEKISFDWMTPVRSFEDVFLSGKIPHPDTAYVPQCHYLPDMQAFYGHSKDGELHFAAKGGFNNESHNHNDLGNFILMRNGGYILPDLGNLPYTSKTFSPYRYEIWVLQSAWHSCATLNGFDQMNGDTYRATDTEMKESDGRYVFSMELSGAYVPEAGIESYRRSFEFDTVNDSLFITDRVRGEALRDTEIHFIAVREPEILSSNEVLLRGDEGDCLMRFEGTIQNLELITHSLEAENKKADFKSDYAYKVSVHFDGEKNDRTIKTVITPVRGKVKETEKHES